MFPRAQSLRGLLALGLALIGGARAGAQLASKSPFLPPTTAGGPASPTAGAPLEYRGMMQTSKGLRARIVDPSRRAGVWLLANERDPNFDAVVKSIDIEHDTVTVDYQGRSMTLAQHVAKVASAGTAQLPPGPPGVASNMPPAIAQSVVVNPTPADEQRRLEAVASEVARRRQLREQASQPAMPGTPVTLPQLQQQLQQTLPQNANQQNNNAQRGGQQRAGQRPRGNQP